MPKIFISYRRSDTQMVAGRLRESLARHLGERAIFRDKNTIAAGEDWTKAVETALGGGVVVLALIGPGWVTARDDSGRRRLDDPGDWTRVELERAFEHKSRVIPLLVDDARMPAEADLPDSLKPLARSNALRLRDDDWDSDIERLLRALGGADAWSSLRRTAVAVAAVLAVILAGGIGYWFVSSDDRGDPKPSVSSGGATYRADIVETLRQEQAQALELLNSDKPKAIGLIDANLGKIANTLRAFPDDANLYALDGYGAKNVYASSKDILVPAKRESYLARARESFEQALKHDPGNAGAVNGLGNVLFYQRRFDDAIRYYQRAIDLAGGRDKYPEAAQDLDLAMRVKNGQVPFDF
jgi:tetratricopeptide (TPR) repeat protein